MRGASALLPLLRSCIIAAATLRGRGITPAREGRGRGVRGVTTAWERRERGVRTAGGASLWRERGVTTASFKACRHTWPVLNLLRYFFGWCVTFDSVQERCKLVDLPEAKRKF